MSFGGQSQPFTFTYDAASAPTVTALSIIEASPVLKTDLTITGTQFGTVSDTKVFLQKDGENVYELNVNSIPDSNTINCKLGGGRTGTYNVVVFVSTVGFSSPAAAN